MDYLKVGYIKSTHGLKGEVKVGFSTDQFSEWFKKGSHLYLKNADGSFKEMTISSFYTIPKDMGLMCFEGLNSIEQVQNLVKSSLFGEKKEFKGRIYLSDLVGFTLKDEEGKELGSVDGFTQISGRYYLITAEKYLPYIPDAIIKEIDSEHRCIVLTESGKEVLLNA